MDCAVFEFSREVADRHRQDAVAVCHPCHFTARGKVTRVIFVEPLYFGGFTADSLVLDSCYVPSSRSL